MCAVCGSKFVGEKAKWKHMADSHPVRHIQAALAGQPIMVPAKLSAAKYGPELFENDAKEAKVAVVGCGPQHQLEEKEHKDQMQIDPEVQAAVDAQIEANIRVARDAPAEVPVVEQQGEVKAAIEEVEGQAEPAGDEEEAKRQQDEVDDEGAQELDAELNDEGPQEDLRVRPMDAGELVARLSLVQMFEDLHVPASWYRALMEHYMQVWNGPMIADFVRVLHQLEGFSFFAMAAVMWFCFIIVMCAKRGPSLVGVGKWISRLWCLLPLILMLYIFLRLPGAKAQGVLEVFDLQHIYESPFPTYAAYGGLAFVGVLLAWRLCQLVSTTLEQALVSGKNHLAGAARDMVAQAVRGAAKEAHSILSDGVSNKTVTPIDIKAAEVSATAVTAAAYELKAEISPAKGTVADPTKPPVYIPPVAMHQVTGPILALGAVIDEPKNLSSQMTSSGLISHSERKQDVVKKEETSLLSKTALFITEVTVIASALSAVYAGARHYFSSPKKEAEKRESLNTLASAFSLGIAPVAFAQAGWDGVLSAMKWLFSSVAALRALGSGVRNLFGIQITLPEWITNFSFLHDDVEPLAVGDYRQAGVSAWIHDYITGAVTNMKLRLSGSYLTPSESKLVEQINVQLAKLDELEKLYPDYYAGYASLATDSKAEMERWNASPVAVNVQRLYADIFNDSQKDRAIPARMVLEEEMRLRRVTNESQVAAIVGEPMTVRLWLARVCGLSDEHIRMLKKRVHLVLAVAIVFVAAYLWWYMHPKKTQNDRKESDLGKRGFDKAANVGDADFSVRDDERKMAYERVQEEEDDRLADKVYGAGADEGDLHRKQGRRATKAALASSWQAAEEHVAKVKAAGGIDWNDINESLNATPVKTMAQLSEEIRQNKVNADAKLKTLGEIEKRLMEERKLYLAAQQAIITERATAAAKLAKVKADMETNASALKSNRDSVTEIQAAIKVANAPLLAAIEVQRQEIEKLKAARVQEAANLEVDPVATASVINAASNTEKRESALICQACLTRAVGWVQTVKPIPTMVKQLQAKLSRTYAPKPLKNCTKDAKFVHLDQPELIAQHINRCHASIPCPWGAKCARGAGNCKWMCSAIPRRAEDIAGEQMSLNAKSGYYETKQGVAKVPYVASGAKEAQVMQVMCKRCDHTVDKCIAADYVCCSADKKESLVTKAQTDTPADLTAHGAYVVAEPFAFTNASVFAKRARIPLHFWQSLSDEQKHTAKLVYGQLELLLASVTKYQIDKFADQGDADALLISLPDSWRVPSIKALDAETLEANDDVHMAVWRPAGDGFLNRRQNGPWSGVQNGYGRYRINTLAGDCGSPVMVAVGKVMRLVGFHAVGNQDALNGCCYLNAARWNELLQAKNVIAGPVLKA